MSAASPVKDLAMAQYIPSLKQVAVLRLLKQLSEVYSTMSHRGARGAAALH